MPENEKASRFRYLLAFILVVLLINSIRSIADVHKSVGRLDQAKFELERLKVENERLKGDITYIQTPEYLQKAAIEELNMAKPGETILIVEQLSPKDGPEADSSQPAPLTKPTPLELWAAMFRLQDFYFSWQNKAF